METKKEAWKERMDAARDLPLPPRLDFSASSQELKQGLALRVKGFNRNRLGAALDPTEFDLPEKTSSNRL
jgi:hypothetical protein